nr:protein Daple-like [Ipomoea batatas]
MLRVYHTRGRPTSSHTQSDDEESSVGVMADSTLEGVKSGTVFSPPRTSAPQVITINSPARVDHPSEPPLGSPIEYDPHDPLFARGYSGTSRPRSLRPYHPDHINFIRHGVREMVPAATRFWMDSSPMDALSSHLVGDLMNATHEATLKELDALKIAHTVLEHTHSTLQSEHEKQQVAHTHTLEHAIEDWQGTEDFSRAADDYACSRMPSLLRYWLSSPDRSGQAMADAMSGWYDTQDYQAYRGPPLVQREMQDQLYGKLRRRFTSFSIVGWKLPDYLPLRRPPAPVMPASTTTPDGFLMSPERAGETSSVALPSDPVGGSGAVGSVDPSLSLPFTFGSGFSGSAAGSAAP